jgi:hypothetical protein
MQEAVVLFLLLVLVVFVVTRWVMRQPLPRNEAMRAAVQGAPDRGNAGPLYTGVERRNRPDRRTGERRRTDIDASLGHA